MTEDWWVSPEKVQWIQTVLDSYRRWLGCDLIDRLGPPEAQARTVFGVPFVVVSHGPEGDPILNYGNRTALELWEMDWSEFSRTPSRLTTEPMNRDERSRMLAEAAARGYFSNYRGVRISKSGRRFMVEDAIVWNLTDREGRPQGQAATFSRWRFLG